MRYLSSVQTLIVSLLAASALVNANTGISSRELSQAACDPSTASNAIIHTGDTAALTSAAQQSPSDGYLVWWAAQMSSSSPAYENSVYIPTTSDSCIGLGFYWTIASNTIQIAVVVHNDKKGGWASIGFSETGGMRGADVVYFTTSTSSLVDAHLLDSLIKPIADSKQDWTLKGHSVTDDGYIIFEAERALQNTNDPSFDRAFTNDSPIFIEDHKLIGAWGSSSDVTYHFNNRVRTSIQLFKSSEGDIAPGLDYEAFLEEMNSRSTGSADLTLTSFPIPVTTTTYHEEFFSTSDLINLGLFSDSSSQRNIIGYEFIIQPSSLKYMHHILLYGHYNNQKNTQSPVFVWTPGDEFLYFPPGTGLVLGGDEFDSFTLQYHVDNSDLDENQVDTGSGIRFYYSNTPVTNQVAMMQVGDPNVRLIGQLVGSGLTRHEFTCPSTCTENEFVDTKVTVVRESLHMHSYGERIVNQILRNGKVIHEAYIDYWDFDQSGTPAPRQQPYQIQKGDAFKTTCFFNGNSGTRFGLGSDDEMCMAFLLYYPKQALNTCGVMYSNPSCRSEHEGATELQEVEEIGRVFGNADADTGTDDDADESCSSSFTEVDLGSLLLRYKSTESVLTVEMETTEKAWLGFGINPNGLMLDSDAIIGTLSSGVAKYRLERVKASSGALLLQDERQTLVESSFFQNEDKTVMVFTKLLDDHENDMTISPRGETTFIYAVGYENMLAFGHKKAGSITLNLDPCSSDSGDNGDNGLIGTKNKFEIFFRVHGIIASVAFGLMVPIAIFTSSLRSLFTDSHVWFVIHFGLNGLSYLLMTILFGLVIYGKNAIQGQHFQRSHEIVGLLMFIIMSLQVVAGILRPKGSKQPTQGQSEEENGFNVDRKPSSDEGQKSSFRVLWENAHLLGGILIVALSMYQIRTGIDLYHQIYGSTRYQVLYTIWVMIVCLMMIFVLFSNFRRRYGTKSKKPERSETPPMI